jgi:hypothetical protein
MCFGDTALLDDVAATAAFVEPKDRPVGATATASELGAQFDDEGPVSFEGSAYAISSGEKAMMLGLFEGTYNADLAAQSLNPFDVAAYIAREPEDGVLASVSEVWVLPFAGRDAVNLRDHELIRIR